MANFGKYLIRFNFFEFLFIILMIFEKKIIIAMKLKYWYDKLCRRKLVSAISLNVLIIICHVAYL